MIYRHAFDLLCYTLPMVPGILPSQLGSLSEGRTCIGTGWHSLLCWRQTWLVTLPGFTQIPELRAGALSCETSSGHCPKIVRGTSKARSLCRSQAVQLQSRTQNIRRKLQQRPSSPGPELQPGCWRKQCFGNSTFYKATQRCRRLAVFVCVCGRNARA